MAREMTALKESIDIARSRNEVLENQSHDHKAELERLRRVSLHFIAILFVNITCITRLDACLSCLCNYTLICSL